MFIEFPTPDLTAEGYRPGPAARFRADQVAAVVPVPRDTSTPVTLSTGQHLATVHLCGGGRFDVLAEAGEVAARIGQSNFTARTLAAFRARSAQR